VRRAQEKKGDGRRGKKGDGRRETGGGRREAGKEES